MKKLLRLSAIASAALVIATAASATADDFYKGKTVRVTVGLAPGGGYDTYARIVARHMGKHIPGNPSFVVDNMEGAGA
jgi:tripartite-type tricarboxylate transporter receptor subunit TctC